MAMESAGAELSATLSAEAEAIKRSTDCVYFLASPLTCKKGSECEYRHSEAARFNTRDCWYWFNGNCLNPKCSFRHPPIDGLFEVPGTSSASGQIPLDSVASLTSTSVPGFTSAYNTNKQYVPCYYFQKGLCVKGGRCSFMHGPQLSWNADLHQLPVASASPSDQPSTKVKRIPNGNAPELEGANALFDKEAEMLPNAGEHTLQAESKPDSNFSSEDRPLYRHQEEFVGFESNSVPLESDDAHALAVSWTSHSLDEFQNGRESDEFLGESSPGFDVLVDDQVEELDYFKNEDEYVRSPVNGIYSFNGFEYQHPEYEAVGLDRDQYREMREYERYGSIHHEQHLASWRSLERPQLYGRTSHGKRSYNMMGRSDLRHRLSKKRRIDRRNSSVAADRSHRGNGYINWDISHRRCPFMDDQCFPKEYLSSRLRGRITIPTSSSPDRHANSRRRQRKRHRSSPVGRINYQVEHHGRSKRRSNEHSRSNEEKSGRHIVSRGFSDSLNFAGPKSLAELRSSKISSEPGKDLDGQKSEDPLLFEAPRSLSVILKRKRDIALSIGSDSSSRGRDVVESRSGYSSVAEKSELIPREDTDLPNDGCFSTKQDVYESDDGMLNRVDDHELDTCVQKSGEYDYEEDRGGEYKEDGQDDDEDEDDFAKKVGVMLS